MFYASAQFDFSLQDHGDNFDIVWRDRNTTGPRHEKLITHSHQIQAAHAATGWDGIARVGVKPTGVVSRIVAVQTLPGRAHKDHFRVESQVSQ